MKRAGVAILVTGLLGTLGLPTASADPITINYLGTGANEGLGATAIFTLVNPTTLNMVLTNISTAPFGGVNGSADMVLSSIGLNLGASSITGGLISLYGGSTVVRRSGSSWQPYSFSGNLNRKYGFSNTGVGNVGPGVVPGALNVITSHRAGGSAVTRFSGHTGLPGGLNFGLVAPGSTAFGRKKFIRDGVDVTLHLDHPLRGLSFLRSGSYVEFGSDHAFVPGSAAIPEPSTIFLLSAGVAGLAGYRWRRRKKSSAGHGLDLP